MKNKTMKIFCIITILLFVFVFFLPKAQSKEIIINIVKATTETTETSAQITQPGTLIQQLPGDRQPDPDITWKQRIGGSIQVWCKLKNIERLIREDDYQFRINLYVNGRRKDQFNLFKPKPIHYVREANLFNIGVKALTWLFGGAEAVKAKESASYVLNPDGEKTVYCEYLVWVPGQARWEGTEFYSNKDEPLVFRWNIIQLTSEQIKDLEEYEDTIRTTKEIVKKIQVERPDVYEQFKDQIDEAIKNAEEQKEQKIKEIHSGGAH